MLKIISRGETDVKKHRLVGSVGRALMKQINLYNTHLTSTLSATKPVTKFVELKDIRISAKFNDIQRNWLKISKVKSHEKR
ncbi:hypothetical protein XB82_13320 [Acinetobacter baumannii]|nr:hypothetical protein [Acinetobacter baumannii]